MINFFSTDMMMFLIFQSFQLNHFLNDLKSTGHYFLLELILHDLFVFGNGFSSSNSSHILQSSSFCFNATFSIFLRFSYTLLCFYTNLLNVHFLRFFFSEFFNGCLQCFIHKRVRLFGILLMVKKILLMLKNDFVDGINIT